ncbi:MAG: hypothetical protein Q4C56_09755 [Peptococcaceae bacterium]|nr:hypothetical protein [Peptococcaceae bacterium]
MGIYIFLYCVIAVIAPTIVILVVLDRTRQLRLELGAALDRIEKRLNKMDALTLNDLSTQVDALQSEMQELRQSLGMPGDAQEKEKRS